MEINLRPWAEGDDALLARLMGDPGMTEHLGGPEQAEQLRRRHQRYLKHEPGKGGMFVIVAGPQAQAAGSIGYWESEWDGQAAWETGWSVLPEFQGQGLATLATAAILPKVRAEGAYRYLYAFPAVDNGPSNAICRKAGFTLLGPDEVEYPKGQMMRANVWRLDLFGAVT